MSLSSRYSSLVTHHPIVIIAITLIITLISILTSIFISELPDFSNPIKGFIPRQTNIRKNYNAWKTLIEETSISRDGGEASRDKFYTSPYIPDKNRSSDLSSGLLHHRVVRQFNGRQSPPSSRFFRNEPADNSSPLCEPTPDKQLVKVALQFNGFTYDSFLDLCTIQTRLENLPSYKPSCSPQCHCKTLSLVNRITERYQLTTCRLLTTEQFNNFTLLLSECLSGEWNVTEFCAVLEQYYIEENGYSNVNSKQLTLLYFPVLSGEPAVDFFKDVELNRGNFEMSNARIQAVDFGVRNLVFDEYLVRDTCWMGLALCLVLIIMLFYTGSVFITAMTFSSMMFTLLVSFFIYTILLQIEYFPFMNLLSAVVVIGIGADDLFIYYTTWSAIKNSRNASILRRIVHSTLRYAAAAMFVTSASTAAALFACVYTDVLIVRCFAIFSGICVVVHYILLVTWIPATFVLYEKYGLRLTLKILNTDNHIIKTCSNLKTKIRKLQRKFLCKFSIIATAWYIWLPLFLCLIVGSCVVLFVWPRFSLPSNQMFEMFSPTHLLEQFDSNVKPKFSLTKQQTAYIPVTFIWGLEKPQRLNLNEYFDLKSHPPIKTTPLPSFSGSNVQSWLLKFCFDLRHQPYFNTSQLQPYGCFIEQFARHLRQPCTETERTCCNIKLPSDNDDIPECLAKWSNSTRSMILDAGLPGLRYRVGKIQPSVAVVSFWTNYSISHNFTQTSEFYSQVQTFIHQQTVRCPRGWNCEPLVTAGGGWLFYDIQQTLISSIPWGLLIVLGICTAIILITTMNVLITVCSVLTISSSILTLLAALVLLGWQLNILESVIVLLAVGMSLDFTLHMAIAYKVSHATLDRKNRVKTCIHHISGSITAAMLTTFCAGLSMLPAQIIAYNKLGIFLILVSFISWLHTILLLPALLVLIGPVGNFLQLEYNCHQRRPKPYRSADKTVYSEDASSEAMTVTAQTLSSMVVMERIEEETDVTPSLSEATCSLVEHNLTTIDEENSDCESTPLNITHNSIGANGRLS